MAVKYKVDIGLEIHAQLLVQTKLFCGCSTVFGDEPNSNTCPICLGLPGAIPVVNKKAVEFAIKMGLATNCRINKNTIFARKNYFYPDLPKGYQISQYQFPVCENGFIEIETEAGIRKKIKIDRIHLEEDAGKSIHTDDETLIDFNRSGIPLIEIVSAPELDSSEEAYLFMKKIRQYLQYIDISDGNLEEGSLRCDANISVRPINQKKLGTRTEIKNLNSFRNVEHALEYEIARQTKRLRVGESIVQETLLWNDKISVTYPMRKKEESEDYRYFPEPDLLKLELHSDQIDQIRTQLPELPESKLDRMINQYGLPRYDAKIISETTSQAAYFESAANYCPDKKIISNWIMTEVLRVIKEVKYSIDDFPVGPERLGKLCNLIHDKTISGKIAKKVFNEMLADLSEPEKIIKKNEWQQITEEKVLLKIIKDIIKNNQEQVDQYRSGKSKIMEFFIGQVMHNTRGMAAPETVVRLLKRELK